MYVCMCLESMCPSGLDKDYNELLEKISAKQKQLRMAKEQLVGPASVCIAIDRYIILSRNWFITNILDTQPITLLCTIPSINDFDSLSCAGGRRGTREREGRGPQGVGEQTGVGADGATETDALGSGVGGQRIIIT